MRVSLKVGATLVPLAGAAGVAERTHSSAADFTLTPEIATQVDAFIRASHSRVTDRGNLLSVVTFSTTRQFASPAEAQIWCLDYDATTPRSGILVFDSLLPTGAILRRHMAGAVVSPPRRRCIGATAQVDYTVKGGAVTPAGGGTLATVTINPSGADNSITYTAAVAGTAGNSISITYTTPTQNALAIGVVGSAITVAAGSKARMFISADFGAGVENLVMSPSGSDYSARIGEINYGLYSDAGTWYLEKFADLTASFISTGTAAFPDGVAGWMTNGGGATGTPTVTAAAPTAAQVIAALNASAAVSALVNVSASGVVTGAVAAVAATNLTGGTN